MSNPLPPHPGPAGTHPLEALGEALAIALERELGRGVDDRDPGRLTGLRRKGPDPAGPDPAEAEGRLDAEGS